MFDWDDEDRENLNMLDRDDYEDGQGHIKILPKGFDPNPDLGYQSIALSKLAGAIMTKLAEDDDKPIGGYEWNVIDTGLYQLELFGPAGVFDDVLSLVDSCAADFPDLHILRGAIFFDITEEARCGYSYAEIKNGEKTSLQGEECFKDDDDDEILSALQKAVIETVEPVVYKWLQEKGDISKILNNKAAIKAKYDLGINYLLGIGVDEDFDQAETLFREAYEIENTGAPIGEFDFGFSIYLKGMDAQKTLITPILPLTAMLIYLSGYFKNQRKWTDFHVPNHVWNLVNVTIMEETFRKIRKKRYIGIKKRRRKTIMMSMPGNPWLLPTMKRRL